jgi:hypothetical protein
LDRFGSGFDDDNHGCSDDDNHDSPDHNDHDCSANIHSFVYGGVAGSCV